MKCIRESRAQRVLGYSAINPMKFEQLSKVVIAHVQPSLKVSARGMMESIYNGLGETPLALELL